VKQKVTQLSQRAVEDLRQRILSGELPPGTRLPSERELTETFGISRTALRDALAALEGMGLVEAHVGRGRFVSGPASPAQSVAAANNWLQMHRAELEDLNEVRQLLEPAAVARIPEAELPAVTARTAAVLARQQEALAEGDLETAGRLDVAFHTALVEATANLPLRTLTQAMVESSEPASVAVYEVPGAAANSIRQHEAILDALREGDKELLRVLVARHQRHASRFALDQSVKSV
jgi:DNA-binding FadR family transcriptional regulator